MQRAVIVHGSGNVTVADGKNHHGGNFAPYDLDAAFKKGATVANVLPIGSGTSFLLIIDEKDAPR